MNNQSYYSCATFLRIGHLKTEITRKRSWCSRFKKIYICNFSINASFCHSPKYCWRSTNICHVCLFYCDTYNCTTVEVRCMMPRESTPHHNYICMHTYSKYGGISVKYRRKSCKQIVVVVVVFLLIACQ